MSKLNLRENLLEQADAAFLELIQHIGELLDAAQFYIERYPVTSQSTAIKLGELCIAISDLGTLPTALAAELTRWKRGEERELSRLVLETELLNELYLTMEAMMLFFIRENIDLSKFSLSLVKHQYNVLLDCNNQL